mgnify:FL=1
MKFLQYLGRSFADTLLLLLGVTGVTFSLMSAYTVPADETQCFLYCLLFSALFSFLFHIRAHGRPICIAVLLLFALCLFLYRERLYNAVLAFLSVLTDTVRENTNLNLYVDAGTSSRIVLLHRLDEFFCFLPALLACVFGLFWVRLRSFLLCLLIAVPLMGLCVVLIDAAPETAPVLLFAIFCVVCVCTGYLRRSQSQRQALATLVLLPLAAGFVLLVSVLFPSEDYVRSPFGDRLFSFFEQLVTLRYDPEISMDPGSESSGPEVSGPHTAAPMQQPLPLTGVDSPRFTGRNVLSLTTEDFTGPLLLRGYSLIDYTGSAWEPADDVQSNFPPNTIQTYTGSALRYLPDSVLHTMTVRPMYAADRKSIVYTPYFYAGVEASDPTFSGDSALYAMTSRSALYTFYTPGAGYIDNPPHIIASMSPYDDEALDRYRSVDGVVAALLLDYFADGIAALDALHFPQMLGCISGNDSVALITRSESDARSLSCELERYCKQT